MFISDQNKGTMKYILIIIGAILLCISGYAQEINQSFSIGNKDQIIIKTDYASLTIHESTSSDIQVEGTVRYNGIPASDAIQLDWDGASGRLYVKTDIKEWSFREKYEKIKSEEIDKMSKEELVEIVKSKYKQGSWDFRAHLDIYIPKSVQSLEISSTYGSIEMKNIPQRLAVKNTYGSIDASLPLEFESCSLKSTYSTVTVDIPKTTSTSVQLQSNYGEIFTDVDISIDKNASTSQAYKTIIVGSVNSGKSRKLLMRSDYSNIYLKKS